MEYLLHIAVLIAIYVILTVSLDLLVGHTGLLSIAHAAFFGIGAYTSAILTLRAELPCVIACVGGMLVAASVASAVALPLLRLSDEYFIIATFALQVIVVSLFNNWVTLTGGPMGIPGIGPATVGGLKIVSRGAMLAVAAGCAMCAYVSVWRLTSGPFGRSLHALREDEVFASAMGKATARVRIIVFAISAALAALAGCLYAHYITFVDPSSFGVMESVLIVSMVIIGGAGSLWGPLIGAVVLVSLPELLRFIGLPSSVAANVRQIIYGGLLVAMMVVRPQGLVGKYAFGK